DAKSISKGCATMVHAIAMLLAVLCHLAGCVVLALRLLMRCPLFEFAVYIKPVSVFTREAAYFMQSDGSSIVLETCDEFDPGMVVVVLDVVAHIQTQPFGSGQIPV